MALHVIRHTIRYIRNQAQHHARKSYQASVILAVPGDHGFVV